MPSCYELRRSGSGRNFKCCQQGKRQMEISLWKFVFPWWIQQQLKVLIFRWVTYLSLNIKHTVSLMWIQVGIAYSCSSFELSKWTVPTCGQTAFAWSQLWFVLTCSAAWWWSAIECAQLYQQVAWKFSANCLRVTPPQGNFHIVESIPFPSSIK